MPLFDLHTHLLPGLDDGAESWEEALVLAREAWEAGGISRLVLTPHWLEGVYVHRPEGIRESCAQLAALLARAGIPLDLLPGAEVHLTPDVPALVRAGELLTLGGHGRHLLLELPLSGLPGYTEQAIFDLALQGVTAILAHPERNAALARSPQRVFDLVGRGALVQLNAGSLFGRYGRTTRQAAEYLVRHRLVHFLGSDAHASPGYFADFAAACRRLADLAGEEAARAILCEYPEAVWHGRTVTVMEPLAPELPARSPSRPGPGPGLVSRLFSRRQP